MTRMEFMQVAAYIGVGCGKPLEREALEVYFDLLGDLPVASLRAAAKDVLLKRKWSSFPTVAELHEAAIANSVTYSADGEPILPTGREPTKTELEEYWAWHRARNRRMLSR